MAIGIYQAATALTGLEKWQSVISQNLAASSVPGYKQAVVAFESEEVSQNSKNPVAIKNTNEGADTTLARGIARNSFLAGEVATTGMPTDMAIDGKGFFEVSDPAGTKIYTRNGSFHFNSENILVNSQGFKVKGESGDISRIPGGGDIIIDRTGRITQNGQEINRIAVVDIKNPETLRSVQGGFLAAKDGSTATGTIDKTSVLQGYLESSNVNPVYQMTQMIQVSQAYAINSKVISEIDDQESQTIRYLGSA